MSDPEAVARIRSYLEANRANYTRDALRDKLIADGHDPQAVDAAMAQVYSGAGESGPTNISGSKTSTFVLAIVGTVLLNAGVCVVGGTFLVLGPLANILGAVLCIIAIAVLRQSNPTVARGIRWGCAIWAVLVIALTIAIFWQLTYQH